MCVAFSNLLCGGDGERKPWETIRSESRIYDNFNFDGRQDFR